MENNTTTTTREALVKDFNTLKQDTAKVVEDVKQHGTARVEEAKKKVTDTVLFLREQVNAHPFALLGAGFALGYLFALRRRA